MTLLLYNKGAKSNSVKYGLTAGHDGSVYWYTRPNKRIPRNTEQEYISSIEKLIKIGYIEVVHVSEEERQAIVEEIRQSIMSL